MGKIGEKLSGREELYYKLGMGKSTSAIQSKESFRVLLLSFIDDLRCFLCETGRFITKTFGL
jgi:hypothetical protein